MKYLDYIKDISVMKWGNEYQDYFWGTKLIARNSYVGCPPNCTTATKCFIAIMGCPMPTQDKSIGANQFHNNLINGWKAIPYDKSKLENGDIVEWGGNGNHVAVFQDFQNNVPMISGSFYTGENGKAYDKERGGYSKRDSIGTTIRAIYDWAMAKYQYRLFHYVSVDIESSWCGQKPTYILKNPTIFMKHSDRDENKKQIEVSEFNHNVRDNYGLGSKTLGMARKGIYDVKALKEADGYTWANVDGKWIAIMSGVKLLEKEIQEITLMERINELAKQIVDLSK